MSSLNKTRNDLFLDIAVFLAFLLAMAPRLTGIPVHEWLSLAFAGAIVVHLLLHWEWIVGVAPKFFALVFHESRFNFIVDLVFFLALILIMVSGIAISKSALPAFGLRLPFSFVWKQVHGISAEVALITLGIHCGMHLKWIGHNVKRYVLAPLGDPFRKRAASADVIGGAR